MASDDIKEILKNGSKTKLMQLAIDLREFTVDGLPNPTLTQKEIQVVKDKAKEEGWDGELFRATYKARDIEAMTLQVKGQVYEAIYYLQEFCKELQRIEILLDMLKEDYIKGYNDKTDKYEDILNRTPKEMEEDINKAKRLVINTLEDITHTKMLMQYGNDLIDKGETLDRKLDKKLTKEDLFTILYRFYKQIINNSKMGFFLVVKSEFAGYRLYKKEQYEDLKRAFTTKNLLTVGNVVLSLEHLDYLLELIGEYKPELLELIRKDSDMFIPDKKQIKEYRDYLETYILPPLRKGDKKMFYTEEYLLNDLDEETKKMLKEADTNLEEYVRYGK